MAPSGQGYGKARKGDRFATGRQAAPHRTWAGSSQVPRYAPETEKNPSSMRISRTADGRGLSAPVARAACSGCAPSARDPSCADVRYVRSLRHAGTPDLA